MVKREFYLNRISSLIDKDIIKVITGVRRCGKSYMFNLIIDELINRGISQKNIILINFESSKYNNVSNSMELNLLIESLIENIEDRVYLFFDEIQIVDAWEKSINACRVDYDCDIYITGSNSKLLSGELGTLLSGRYIELKMYPFSYNEFLDYKKLLPNDESFKEYLIYGGMPLSLSLEIEEDKLDYLNDVHNSIVLKDIVERYNIRNVNLLKRIVKFSLDNIGKIFSASSISKYLKKKENIQVNPNTIYNYLEYLENACFFYKVNRENIEGKKILSINEKYYCVDHGFNQSIIGRNEFNSGRIIENIVYFELLRKGYEITIGQIGNYEIDFVCKKYGKKIYVQVTRELSCDETIEREFRPLLLVNDNYPKYVISMDKFDLSHEGIIHLNLIDFLTKDII